MRELLALPEDFETRNGSVDERAEALLEDASGLILGEVSGSDALWLSDDSEPVPPQVVAVCVAVAYRAWSNPDALSSEALGEHSQSWADRSGEALRLTKQERRTVRKAAGLSTIGSITLESPYSGPPLENDLL